MATCVDCIHFKDAVAGEGLCKYEHPETHFTMAQNKEIRRDNGWTKTTATNSSCGRFVVIP